MKNTPTDFLGLSGTSLFHHGIDFIFALFPRTFHKCIFVKPYRTIAILVKKYYNNIVFFFYLFYVFVFEFDDKSMIGKNDFVVFKFSRADPLGNAVSGG